MVDEENIDVDEFNYQDVSEFFYVQASYDYDYWYYFILSGWWDVFFIFGGDVQVANFFFVGVVWAFMQECWMEGVEWFNFGKFCVFYGLMGNFCLGIYSVCGFYGYNDVFLYGNNIGIVFIVFVNEGLIWELVCKYNFVVDLELLESCFCFIVEYYCYYIEDVIYIILVFLESGFINIVINVVDQCNIGWEVSVEIVNIQGEF